MLDKTNSSKSSRVQSERHWHGRKQGRAQWKLYGSNNVNDSSGWFQGPSRIRLEVLMPVNGDFIQLDFSLSNSRSYLSFWHSKMLTYWYSLFNICLGHHDSVLFIYFSFRFKQMTVLSKHGLADLVLYHLNVSEQCVSDYVHVCSSGK